MKIQSSDLVPGDLISLYHSGKAALPPTLASPGMAAAAQSATVCPADVVLLRGSCVVNEAMLTGESVPQLKVCVVIMGMSLCGDAVARLVSIDVVLRASVPTTTCVGCDGNQEGIDGLSVTDAAEALGAFDTTNRRHIANAVFGGTEVCRSEPLPLANRRLRSFRACYHAVFAAVI